MVNVLKAIESVINVCTKIVAERLYSLAVLTVLNATYHYNWSL